MGQGYSHGEDPGGVSTWCLEDTPEANCIVSKESTVKSKPFCGKSGSHCRTHLSHPCRLGDRVSTVCCSAIWSRMALRRHQSPSAIWSLSGVKRTWRTPRPRGRTENSI